MRRILCSLILISATLLSTDAFAQRCGQENEQMCSNRSDKSVTVLGYGSKGLVLLHKSSEKLGSHTYVSTYGDDNIECVDLYEDPESFKSCDELPGLDEMDPSLEANDPRRLSWFRSDVIQKSSLKEANIQSIKQGPTPCDPDDEECFSFIANVTVEVKGETHTLSQELSTYFTGSLTSLPGDLCFEESSKALLSPDNSRVFVLLRVRGDACQYETFLMSKKLKAPPARKNTRRKTATPKTIHFLDTTSTEVHANISLHTDLSDSKTQTFLMTALETLGPTEIIEQSDQHWDVVVKTKESLASIKSVLFNALSATGIKNITYPFIGVFPPVFYIAVDAMDNGGVLKERYSFPEMHGVFFDDKLFRLTIYSFLNLKGTEKIIFLEKQLDGLERQFQSLTEKWTGYVFHNEVASSSEMDPDDLEDELYDLLATLQGEMRHELDMMLTDLLSKEVDKSRIGLLRKQHDEHRVRADVYRRYVRKTDPLEFRYAELVKALGYHRDLRKNDGNYFSKRMNGQIQKFIMKTTAGNALDLLELFGEDAAALFACENGLKFLNIHYAGDIPNLTAYSWGLCTGTDGYPEFTPMKDPRRAPESTFQQCLSFFEAYPQHQQYALTQTHIPIWITGTDDLEMPGEGDAEIGGMSLTLDECKSIQGLVETSPLKTMVDRRCKDARIIVKTKQASETHFAKARKSYERGKFKKATKLIEKGLKKWKQFEDKSPEEGINLHQICSPEERIGLYHDHGPDSPGKLREKNEKAINTGEWMISWHMELDYQGEGWQPDSYNYAFKAFDLVVYQPESKVTHRIDLRGKANTYTAPGYSYMGPCNRLEVQKNAVAKEGLFCASFNFDCGDNCHMDLLYVRKSKTGLEVMFVEGVMGGWHAIKSKRDLKSFEVIDEIYIDHPKPSYTVDSPD